MAYRSLFQPIDEKAKQEYQKNHSINEDAFNQPAPGTTVNPQAAPQQTNVVAPAGSTQPGSQVPQAPAQQAPGIQISSLGAAIQKAYPEAPKNASLMALWKTLQAQPTDENLVNYMVALIKAVQEGIQAGAAQGAATQPAQAPTTTGQQPQVGNISNSYRPKFKGIDRWALARQRAKENMILESAENDGSDDEKPAESSSKSTKKDDFNDDKNVDYGTEYDETVSGKKGETTIEYKDKEMYKSIFGTSEDPFQDEKDVNYHQSYKENGDKESDVDYSTEYTKPEPFKPEVPKLTSLSDATAVKKTVFTIGEKGIENAGSSTEGKSKVEDDGSDNDDYAPSRPTADNVDEGYYTSYKEYLNESVIEDTLKKTIIREFINDYGEGFDIGIFNEWLEDNYPKIAGDPSAFDELAYAIQGNDTNHIEEDDDPDDDPDNDIDNDDQVDDDFNSEDTYKDVANEYLEDTDIDDYDEDDAIAWCEDNHPEIAEDNDELDNFLDAVCDMFCDDDINESLNDEFYANESSFV